MNTTYIRACSGQSGVSVLACDRELEGESTGVRQKCMAIKSSDARISPLLVRVEDMLPEKLQSMKMIKIPDAIVSPADVETSAYPELKLQM
jgi:hypothetical protein